MFRFAYVFTLFLLIVLSLIIPVFQNPPTKVQAQPAPAQQVKLPVEDSYISYLPGATREKDGPCASGFKGMVGGKEMCTTGFDFGAPDAIYQRIVSPDPVMVSDATVVCDGDGVSGYRVQVIYAHPPETNRYAQYLSSFRQWVKDMDDIFNASAAETGGSRHVRFVHDSSCTPSVLNVEVSSAAINAPWNPYPLWGELEILGYDQSDRKYLVFTETSSYTLGVATFLDDDDPTPGNSNNYGPAYTSSPVAVWGGSNPAHELMHTLGGVNSSAPNGLGGGHCSDEYDRMCYGATTVVCSDSGHEQRFDCNHDDYFHTNPAPGSYLDTHWNTANNRFLIGAVIPVKTWNGSADTDYNNDANWTPNGKPTQGYDCIIPAGAPRYPVVDTNDALCWGKLTVAQGATLSVTSNYILSVVSAEVSGTVTLNPGFFELSSELLVKPTGQINMPENADISFWEDGASLKVDGYLQVSKNFSLYGIGPVDFIINPSGSMWLAATGTPKIDANFINNGSVSQTKTVLASSTTTFLSFTNGDGSENKYAGVEITLGAVGDMGSTTVTVKGNQTCPEVRTGLGSSVRRCYMINTTTQRNATIKFYYSTVEQANHPLPDAFHYNGAGWDALSSTRGGSGIEKYVIASNVSQYNGSGGSPTPFALNDPSVVTYMISLPVIFR